jgi:GDPmannose 4,6-dehydratase
MWMMMQHKKPDNFVIATGVSHTVRQLCEIAFGRLDLDYKKYVVTDPRFVRPAEVEELLGDSSHAHKTLGWEPEVSFKQMIEMMVDADMERLGDKKNP